MDLSVSRQEAESASTNISNGNASAGALLTFNLSSALAPDSILQSPLISSHEQRQFSQPQPLQISLLGEHPLSQPLAQSPQIQSRRIPALVRQLDIPETLQTPTPFPSSRPLGSPVRRMRGLTDDYLDPALRRKTLSPRPSINAVSVAESASVADEIVGLNREVSEKLPSESQDNFDAGEDKNSKARRLKPMLTLETVEYQKNARTRDTYYRNTSNRLKEKLKILGIYTNCIGILYLHRQVKDSGNGNEPTPIVLTNGAHEDEKLSDIAREKMQEFALVVEAIIE